MKYQQLTLALYDLEHAMRTNGYWSSASPSDADLHSAMPFACDVLGLEQWLQWVFIPRMTALITQQTPLPKASIYEYAEDTFAKLENTHDIIVIIKRIDELLS